MYDHDDDWSDCYDVIRVYIKAPYAKFYHADTKEITKYAKNISKGSPSRFIEIFEIPVTYSNNYWSIGAFFVCILIIL